MLVDSCLIICGKSIRPETCCIVHQKRNTADGVPKVAEANLVATIVNGEEVYKGK